MKLTVIYWSGTGNTEEMADLIADGARDAGSEVEVKSVDEADPRDVGACDVLALGCPSMGDEVLEEDEFEPYVASIENAIKGKKMALFGSYGWGDGQWMRDWVQRMRDAGAELLADGLIVNEAPVGDDIERCKSLGRLLAAE
ncbi:MAG: flavodoxin [Gracilibacteraceae bacterium]|jgi:flavodoxin short chain|nr:flavodoxin [Gracilibacteraceae bacterium]